ncbi:MAG: YlxM family DNA-binding protein [Oscillospiraceae bacterium]|nr:YlxM family DNA-binding protein [Oscillospiraceae bacterium]
MDDKTLFMTMLLDFFGDMLTEKQREYYDLYHNEDMSLSEIAERAGISRQGVYDIVLRAEKSLVALEEKTGMVRRWNELRDGLAVAEGLANSILEKSDGESADLARKLVVTLEGLKG